MSHISKIELVIHSLDSLKDACQKLGFEFVENQKSYKWYGRWVGDTPLPEDMNVEDIGKCDHAIRVPECEYEIGIVKRGGNYILVWDYYHAGGLTQKIGLNAGILKQTYTIARVKKEARRKGYRVVEKKMDQGVRMILTI